MPQRYAAASLTGFASSLLRAVGMETDKAACVAEILVEGDLLGHVTHGLHLLPLYLQDIENGGMAKAGEPAVLADYPAAVTWDGHRLPGPWLTVRAIDLAIGRARQLGTCSVVIRRSHHIACLASYLKRVTDQGLMIVLSCSDPWHQSVAPYGGLRPVYSPDPIAAAWPTDGDPVMLDVSMSITSNGRISQFAREGRKLPSQWLLDAAGNPTDDPAAVGTKPAGSVLPLGGLDHGHKGYALGLLVEAMTGGLAGHGRADPKEGWASNTHVQIFDPQLFAGRGDFVRQTSWIAEACRSNPPRPGVDRVRLPGEAGLRRRERQLAEGVELHQGIMPGLEAWAAKLGIKAPPAL